MARQKAPAYQRYPKQIMGDDKVLLMDWDCYGMHNWLLDISWQQDPRGTIPDDMAVLRRWLRNPDEEIWRRVWPQLKTAWPILEGGRRGNAGMMATAKKQENYSNGNRGKEKYANGTQIGSQIEQGLTRKSIEDEEVLSLSLSVEAFDAEPFVRKIQGVWPKSDYSPVCENEILRAFEFEAEQRKCSREDAAKFVTDRFVRIGGLVSNWPNDKKCKIPKLFNVVYSRGYRNADETWMQDGQSPEPPKPLKWKAKE